MKKKEYRKSQFGFSVVEYYPDNKLYSIKNNDKESVHHLVPEEIWDALSMATARSDNYRKSRDYFKEARETEKKRCVDYCQSLVEKHNRFMQDLHHEIEFLHKEMDKLDTNNMTLRIISVISFFAVGILTFFLYI